MGKNRPKTTYLNSKEGEKAIVDARIRSSERPEVSLTFDRWTAVHACMHMCKLVHVCLVYSGELGTSDGSV